MTISAGTRLGSYEILAPLGAGGMGEVYRARDARLGREVALKVLPAELSQDPERLSRFEQEARAASALNHPNIITIYEVGSANGTAFIAMELVEGKTLRELSASDPLPIRRVIGIAVQVAEGLAKAHGVGIVHRDLKPENVMVSKDGYVKILDFGLAKLVEPESGEVSGMPTLVRPETHPGTVLGTVGYMSPEQASGLPLDFRSDQFSFGSILYEIISGQKAFTRKTAAETMSAIIRDEPEPLVKLRPDLAPPVRWIIERCLAKDPEERYASTRDLARDLAGVRDHISEVSSGAEGLVAAPVRRKRALLPVLAGLGLLVLGIVAGRVFRGGRSAGESTAAPRFQRLTFRRGEIHNARFAPDGQTVFYGATWTGDKPRLYFTRLQSPESWAPDLGGVSYDILAVSPSGELAIFDYLENILARVPMAGGTPRQVMTGAEYAGADWAPNGKDLAVVHKVAQRMRLEYPVGNVLLETAGLLGAPRFSPGGDRIAFVEEAGGTSAITVVETTGKGKRALASGWLLVSGAPNWTPDGKEIWFTASQQGEKSTINAVNLAGKLRLVARVPGELELDDISRDGRVLVAHHALVRILMGRAQGEEKDRDLSWLDESIPADLSADGKTLLFSETGQGSGRTPGVYLRKTDGSPAARLGDGFACALSPDGARVIALQPDQRRLLVLPTGPGQTSVLPGEYSSAGWASWLPDGKKIVLAAQRAGGSRRLFVQDVAGGEARPLGPEKLQLFNYCNTVSPDGKTVIATAEGKVVLVPIDGGEARPVPGINPGERPIRWSEDGRSVYVYRRVESPSRIWLLDVATGSRKLFKEVSPAEPTRNVFQFLITPDGKAYVYGFRRGFSDLYVIEGLK